MDEIDIRIRVATIEDLELIFAFISQKAEFDGCKSAFKATVDKLRQTLFCQPPQAKVLFAEIDEIAVGFALFFYKYSSFLAQPSIWVDDLFVQPQMRGKGIGTALMKRLTQIAEKTNCGRIEWTVALSNQPGIAFYKKQGATILDTVKLCRLEPTSMSQLAGKQP